MLKCESVQPQLSAYLDREMPLWKVRLFQWHLKQCPVCAHEATRLLQTHKILHQLHSVKTSDSFLPDVMHQAATITVIEKHQMPAIRRIFRRLESSLAWTRYSFRTRIRPYAVVTSLALLATLVSSITLYQPRLPLPSEQTLTHPQSTREKQGFLVEFEIVPLGQFPKPNLSLNRQVPPFTPP